MPLEDSPSLNGKSDWVEDDRFQSPNNGKRRRITWGLIVVLALLALFLGIQHFRQSSPVISTRGGGVVTGYARDEAEHAVVVDVFVEGTDISARSAADGNFRVEGVPVGEQVVIVGYQGTGYRIPVSVQIGVEVSVGLVRVVATQTP